VPTGFGVLVTASAVLVARSGLTAHHGQSRLVLITGIVVTVILSLVVDLQRRLGASTYAILSDLERRARHDELTGLPARDEIRSCLNAALGDAYRRNASVAVLFLDLDGFKSINDSMGHRAGDELLQQFASQLREVVRANDIVGRYGGDEFVVVCGGLDGPEDGRHVASKIRKAFASPLSVGDGDVLVTPSIGIASANRDEPALCDELIARADQAMYRAKRSGGGVRLYDDVEHQAELDRRAVKRALVPGLAAGEFDVHYQPIVDLSSHSVVSMEGLVRWRHPVHGVLAPGRFLDIAQETGLGARLGEVVLEDATAQIALWNRLGHSDFTVALNLAERQLVDPGFPDLVAAVLDRAGIHAVQLDLEVSEALLVRRVDDASRVLHRLAAMGCRIVIDDFGDSHGAFSRFRHLDLVEVLKIDRSVIADIETDDVSRTVVEASVAMADSLGLTLIAEGIETAEQRNIALDLGVERMQGFLFGRPEASASLSGSSPFGKLNPSPTQSLGSSRRSSKSSKPRALIDG